MSTRIHGIDHLPTLQKLQKALKTERDPQRQMVAIELLMWSFVKRMEDQVAARNIIHAMHKHVLQMLMQSTFPDEPKPDTYKYYSETSSGWTISTDPDAPVGRQWRAVHSDYGERFFTKHDEILPFTCEHMIKQFEKTDLFKSLKDRK